MRRLPLLTLLVLVACSAQPGTPPPSTSSSAPSSSSSSSSEPVFPRTYRNDKLKYVIDYPAGWTVEENAPLSTDQYEVRGTAIIMPASAFSGTTLSETQMHIATPKACPAQPYDARERTLGENIWKESTWSGVGAGNLYQGSLLTLLRDRKQCYAVTYYFHSCNLGPDCGPGRDKPFDKAALLKTFDAVLGTLRFL